MVDAIAAEVPAPVGVPLRALLRPRVTNRVLDGLGKRAAVFDPLVHNTASPTIVRGGHAWNVIPNEVKLQLTVRTRDDATRKQVLEAIARKARAAAEGARAPEPLVRIDLDDYTPALVNDARLAPRMVEVLKKNR